MELSQALEEYRYAVLPLSPKTQGWYLQKLSVLLTWCTSQGKNTLDELTTGDIRRFLANIPTRTNRLTGQPLSTYTIHGYAQVVKGFLQWCAEEGWCSERLAKAVAMPNVEEKVIETFTPAQVKALFAASVQAPTPALAARDRAILAVLFDTGIRASELCGLTLDAVHLDPQEAYLKVFGKGRKEREVGLGKEARTSLYRYLSRHRRAPQGERHVFLTRIHEPLRVPGLESLFVRLRTAAKITGVRCSPHTCRHTYAVRFLEAGGDVYKLSRLLGHTSVKTTDIYLKAYQQREARRDGLSVLDLLGKGR
jgi:site-specific recombinase XerD